MGAIRDRLLNLQAAVMRPFAPLRDRIHGLLEGMSARDRALLYILMIFFTLVGLALGTMGVRSHLNRLEESLDTRRGQLAMVREMAVEYAEGTEQLAEVEGKLRQHEGTTLSAFLEKSADKVQIRDSLKQVKERSSTTMESLEEKKFTAQLRPVTLEQLVGFLYEVETSGYPLLIKTLNAKTIKISGDKHLDVTLDISAYKLLEEEESE
jgi:type II secretory pathway component PulM